MKIKPLILLTTLILTSFVLVGITLSDFPPEVPGIYSPWGDLNDDGIINIFDIVWVAGRYQTTGTPINKTALLYNVSDTLNMLLNKIDELNSTVIEQQVIINGLHNTVIYLNETVQILNGTVNYLNTTVTYLNETIATINGTGLGAPDYDSGWEWVNYGDYRTFTHDLNSYNLLVYAVGQAWEPAQNFYSELCQVFYGGDNYIYPGGASYTVGAYWYAVSENALRVQNFGVGATGGWYNIRVMIWKIPQP